MEPSTLTPTQKINTPKNTPARKKYNQSKHTPIILHIPHPSVNPIPPSRSHPTLQTLETTFFPKKLSSRPIYVKNTLKNNYHTFASLAVTRYAHNVQFMEAIATMRFRQLEKQ